MKLSDLLKPESVILPLRGASKEELIRHLVEALPVDSTDRDPILRAVLEREEVMSTGIGRGVAIPHAKSDRVSGLMAAVGIAEEPLPFDAIDKNPVRIFFLIVSGPGTSSPHIKALSMISRVLNDDRRKEALVSAATVDDVLGALDVTDEEV
jgi:mannitol/fructose-specific phosphotransferase system IIA component (Ntr-type)